MILRRPDKQMLNFWRWQMPIRQHHGDAVDLLRVVRLRVDRLRVFRLRVFLLQVDLLRDLEVQLRVHGEDEIQFKPISGKWLMKKEPLSSLNLAVVMEELYLFKMRQCRDEPIQQVARVAAPLAEGPDHGQLIRRRSFHKWSWQLSTTIELYA